MILSRQKYGSLKLMVGTGLMMLNFASEANAVINCKVQCSSSTKCGKDAKLAAECRKECPKSRCSTVPHANSPISEPMDVKRVENPFNNPDSSHKVLQAVIDAPCEMKHKLVTLAPFSFQEKTFLLMDCPSSEPTETEQAFVKATPTKKPRSSSQISSSSHRKGRTAEPPTTNMREEAGTLLQQPDISSPPSHLPPDYYTETAEGRAEAKAKAKARAEAEPRQKSTVTPTQKSVTVPPKNPMMDMLIKRRGAEAVKKDLEEQLEDAKRPPVNEGTVDAINEKLAYVNAKIEAGVVGGDANSTIADPPKHQPQKTGLNQVLEKRFLEMDKASNQEEHHHPSKDMDFEQDFGD